MTSLTEPHSIPARFLQLTFLTLLLLVSVGVPTVLALVAAVRTFQAEGPSPNAWGWAGGTVLGLACAYTVIHGAQNAIWSLVQLFLKHMEREDALMDAFNSSVEPVGTLPTEPQPPAPLPAGYDEISPRLQTTNEATTDHRLALQILSLMIASKSFDLDGEVAVDKPWSFERCSQNGYTKKWSTWHRVLLRMERAGIGTNLTRKAGWKVDVASVKAGEDLLRKYYAAEGFIWWKDRWLKR